MPRVDRTREVAQNFAPQAAPPPAARQALIPFDPATHGPQLAAHSSGKIGLPRVEAPWSPRAKELAAEALALARGLPEAEAISVALDRILGAPEVRGAKIGIAVENAQGLIFERDVDAKRNPCSNAKLCTAAFALGVLGPRHRFVTEVVKDREHHYLIGAFDPSFTSETLDAIAAAVRAKSPVIAGDLVLDLTRFEGARDPAGFDRYGDQDWQYLARPEALSVNKNLLRFTVSPGDAIGAPARVSTEQRAFEVRSAVETVAPRSEFKLGIDELDGQPIIELKGTVALDYLKGKELLMKTPDPKASFIDELRRAFERAGVRIEGEIRSGSAPEDTKPVHAHRSAPLRELLSESIATSNAFDHEMYALAAAAALSPDGTTSLAGARRAMEQFLVDRLGLDAPELANASGIGNLDRISAGDILKVLGRAANDPRYASILEALAKPGETGTLMTRMLGTAAEGRLRAKTGTGDDAVALSGTVGKGRRAYRFSVLIDDQRSREGSRAVLDAIGIALAELSLSGVRRRGDGKRP